MVETPRFTELSGLWSWLPAFRAIAETEHLPTAAKWLHCGPSALSRALSLLERNVGKQLFTRAGRNLRLNDHGRILLAAVRDAMRRIDDGLDDLRGDDLRGELRVGSTGAGTTALVAPALLRLRAAHPRLTVRMLTHATSSAGEQLRHGEVDVCFQEGPVVAADVVVRRVAELTRSVYCGAHHPFFTRSDLTAADLETAEFAAPPPDSNGAPPDGWPPERPRRIGLVTDQLRVGLELCIEQALLAVVPDVLAAPHRSALRRLLQIPIPPTFVYALHRRPLTNRRSAAIELVDLVAGTPTA